jgi:surface polysaccharide O-acyltransferase-like enzyme
MITSSQQVLAEEAVQPANKTRYYYLDYLKAIAIFMVIFYHVSMLWRGMHDAPLAQRFLYNAVANLCAVCVPLFFLVNGALLFNKSLDLRKHIGKTILLFVTYFIWRIITIPPIALINGEPFGKDQLPDYIQSVLGLHRYPEYNLTHFWFIPVLIGLYAVFPVLKHAYDTQRKALLLLFGALFTVTFFGNFITFLLELIFSTPMTDPESRKTIFTPFDPFSQYSYAFVYFILGGYLHKRYVLEKKEFKWYYLILIWLGGFVYLHFLQFSKMRIYEYFDAVIDSYPEICTLAMASALFVFLSKFSYKVRIMNTIAVLISVSTLGIYYIHAVFRNAQISYEIFEPGYLSTAFERSLAILLVSLLIAVILKQIPIVKKLVQLG